METENKPAAQTPASTPMKKNKTLLIVLGVILLLCLCAGVIAAGIYFFSLQAANNLANQVSQIPNTTTPTNNGNGQDYTPSTGNNSGTNFSANVQTGTLPADFPTDVPIYPGVSVTGSTTTADEQDVLLSAEASSADIYAYYKSQLASGGWTITQDTYAFNVYGITATKNGKSLEVGVVDNSSDDNGTSSVITLAVK